MRSIGLMKSLFVSGLGLLALITFGSSAGAQQITYYNFNTPEAAPSQVSYACPASGVPGQLPNVLFCLDNNNGQNEPGTPGFLNDQAASTNPNPQNANYAVLLTTPTQQQASSAWFSVPQQIANGFSAYFAFRITSDPNSFATADGVAFVIQHSQQSNPLSTTNNITCAATGSGANIVGAPGGCLGYGGIDNSVAIEFDTYANSYDPADTNASTADGGTSNNDNHVAVQNCGAGLPNSPDHSACEVTLAAPPVTIPPTPLTAALNGNLASTFADGNVHQVVISYSGPTEAVPNLLQVYIDPVFNVGTHTPVTGSVPAISGIYNIPNSLTLPSGTAYVGFTSATGAADEQHELLAFTFTPHTPVTQTQPLNPPGTPTVFPFGAHTYTVNYPASVNPTGFNMTVTANTISPNMFQTLLLGGPYQGATCQVYDETGGNCIIYSVSCTQGTAPAACPSIPAGSTDFIAVTSDFNNSTPLITPGFLQGDPLYTQIATITGDGTTATVTCVGECSVTAGQVVTVAQSSIPGFDGTVTVLPNPGINTFTYLNSTVAPSSAPATGGYLTSNNVQNIFVSATDAPFIDSGVSGKTKNFSDFVVTSVTPVPPTMLAISAAPATYGQPVAVTVTVTSANGNPTGNVAVSVDSNPTVYTLPLVAGPTLASGSSASISIPGLSGGTHTINVSYASSGVFAAASTSASISVTATPLASVTPGSLDFGTLYLGGIGLQSVTLSNVGDAPMTINTPFLFDVGNGDSKEFIALNLCPKTLAAAKSCSIEVGFIAGPSYTPQTAILKIMDNAPGSPQSVNLTANVINPQAGFSPRSPAFPAQTVGTTTQQPVTVTNTGATTLSISKVSVTGKNPGDFSVSNGCPSTLAPGASCSLGINFTPAAKGSRSASIVLTDNVQCGSSQLAITGTGK